jgi:PAS domain S-box-containing protein
MILSYAYDPNIWPALVTVALMVFLSWYSWRHRNVPGARLFAIGCLLVGVWAAGSAAGTAATNFGDKVFWIKFQAVCQLPAITYLTCFVLAYSGLDRWLNRRNSILLASLPLIFFLLIVTNDSHHLVWTGFQTGEFVTPLRGIANWVFIAYGFGLGLLSLVVFIWLAVRSPGHRWPVAIMLVGQISGYPVYLLNAIKINLLHPPEFVFLTFIFPVSMYALALYRFHVFDPVPLARSAVIEQMNEGMLVLDLEGKVVDLNPAAGKILEEPQTRLRGRWVAALLPVNLDQLIRSYKSGKMPLDVSLESGKMVRYYNLNLTPLVDHRDRILGWLLLLHDITGQKQVQKQIIEQQRVVATLHERERLARELHDGIGQVLGYISMQAQTIRRWIQNGNSQKAESLLERLAEVARDAHADVRESILSLKAGSSREWSFQSALKRYLDDYQAQYGIHTVLVLEYGLKENIFKPDAQVHLLRVVQEALTNARKHSGAKTVQVTISQGDHRGYITIIDDGTGFDPGRLNKETGMHFGMAFMRERMEQIGGRINIDSRPGAGTIIKLEAPIGN